MKKLSMYLAAATLCLTPCLALADALPFETLPDDVSGIELDMTHPIDNMIKGAWIEKVALGESDTFDMYDYLPASSQVCEKSVLIIL